MTAPPSKNSALNPEFRRLLESVGMDRQWVRGHGAWLYDQQGQKFLDCYAQYGAVALGHSHPGVAAALQRGLAEQIPVMVQPYRAPNAVALAERLVELAPDRLRHCVFTTSGAETVEAGIKVLRTRYPDRPLILATHGAYHGKTMGALAISDEHKLNSFNMEDLPGFMRIPYGDSAALADILERRGDEIAAIILEPIQGESGVNVPPDGYLSQVRALCDQHGVAMVLDEIQTGLGRTGRLFCCEGEGVAPDMMFLAKAIGGGVFPLGACLISEELWNSQFAFTHSSTFANNNLACAAAMAVLDELTETDLLARVQARGDQLMSGLRALAERFPELIADVRGRGLLAALELRPGKISSSFFLSYLHYQGIYVLALTCWLGDRENILALPTLNNNNVLRICPPLIVDEQQVDHILAGLGRGLEILDREAADDIARVLVGLDGPARPKPDAPIVLPPSTLEPSAGPTYAFLCHYTDLQDVVDNDPSLASLSTKQLRKYCSFVADTPPGVGARMQPLRSATGAEATGWLINIGGLPVEMLRRGRDYRLREVCEAVDLAASLGADVVGLGAFTTAFSGRGADVVGRGPTITTGNALTAGMAVAAIERVCERRGIAIQDARVGLVGARGSVGSLAAKLLARLQPAMLDLIGNPSSEPQDILDLRDRLELLMERGECRANTEFQLEHLSQCNIVLSATSALSPILDRAPLSPGTIVCDVARPFDTSEVLRSRDDITVIDGGLVDLPDRTLRFGPNNMQGTPNGVQLACLSETILLALAGETRNFGIGDDVPLEQVDYVMDLAAKHGFNLHEPPLDALDESPQTKRSVG